MQAAESHCWCNSSASRNKNNGGNGGTADGMAESNGRRNGRMAGMAGMAEWQKEWQNGKMAEMDTPALADSTASTYVPLSFAFLTWATRRTKKTWRRILLCSSSVLDFSLSCVKRLVGNKFFDGEVECQTEMATYVLFMVDTHRQRWRWRQRRRRRRRHFNLL